MDPIVAQIVEKLVEFFGLIAVLGAAVGVAVIWTRARRRMESGDTTVVQRLDEVMARLSRLESAVDASAIQIERISESQRFTSRILAERSPADAAPSPNSLPKDGLAR